MTMLKVRWPKAEADNLLPWLSRNQHLSWNEKSVAYMKEYGIHRSGEALRGKQNQMEDEARKQLKEASKLQQEVAFRTRRRKKNAFPPLTIIPQALTPGTPDPRVRRWLQQLRHRQNSSWRGFSRNSNKKRLGESIR